MLKREDLEQMRWQVGDDGESFWVEGFRSQSLFAARLRSVAPALAIACLDGLEALRRVYDSGDPMRTADLVRGMAAFQRALAAAGVEVAP